jgi:signal transduction histidine kinase
VVLWDLRGGYFCKGFRAVGDIQDSGEPMSRGRWETGGIVASVLGAVSLMVLATMLTGWWQDTFPPQRLGADDGMVLAWLESGEEVSLEHVLDLPDSAWVSPAEVATQSAEEQGPGRWYQVRLPAADKQRGSALLAHTGGLFWDVSAYWETAGVWRTARTGENLGWSERAVLSQDAALWIDRGSGEATTVYVRLLEKDVPGENFLYWENGMEGRINLEVLTYLHIGYFAVWLAVLAYNFLLAVVLKRRAIYSYVLYVAAFGGMIYYGTGFDGLINGWEVSRARVAGTLVLVHVHLWALTWFARELLGATQSKAARRLFWTIDGLLGISAVLLGLWSAALIDGMVMYHATTLIMTIVAVALLGFAARRWWRGQLVAAWFLLAFLPALGAFTWLWVISFFPHSPSRYTTVPLLVGSATEFVLMSLVLAFHYRQIEMENSRIKAGQAEALRREVALRTQELSELTAQLGASNRLKDRIFSVLGHDLRSPLATTISFAEVLAQDPRFFAPAELAQQASWLKQTNEQMLQLLEDLLSWARAEGGEMSLSMTDLSVMDLVAGPVELLCAVGRGKGVLVEASVPASLVVRGDQKTLQAVIRNLVSNSLKFTGAGGRVSVSAEAIDDRVLVTVTDTGRGMSAEVVARLMSGNGGITTEGTAREKGSGFGWVLCVQCVRLNGGELRVMSEPGVGTRVEILLPRAPDNAVVRRTADRSEGVSSA